MKFDSIFIANLSEIARPLARLMDKKKAEIEINEDHYLCDRFLFSDEKNRILITPYLINRDFFEFSRKITGFSRLINLSPKKIDESICESIIKDKILFEKLVFFIKKNPRIKLISYATTEEFTELVKLLRKNGLIFQTPEMPNFGKEWTSSFFDSKSGFRQSVYNLKGNFPEIPDGMICDGITEVIAWGEYFLNKYGGCVIKSNRGLAGAGLKIIKIEQIDNNDIKKYLTDILRENYWSKDLVVVEKYIESDKKISGGFPNIELKIDENGVKTLYFCGMRVSDEGVFLGIEIGRGAIPFHVRRCLRQSAIKFGHFLKTAGYKGFFEIDWVYGLDHKIYAIEANLRRTGGTHVYEIAKTLLGNDFQKKYYLTATNIQIAHKLKNKSFMEVKNKLSDILYPIQGKKKGVLITIYSQLELGKLGYIVIGKDKKETIEIEKNFLKRI